MGTFRYWSIVWPLALVGQILLGALAQANPHSSDLPLKAIRKVEFTTDEGTWISVDVTPDGKFIVFDLLGDLYRLPIEGGQAVQITQGLPYDAQPRVSPNGEWIAFISDRDGAKNLWIMKIDGSKSRQLTTLDDRPGPVSPGWRGPQSPIWSPDGQHVVVSLLGRDGGKTLVQIPIDGGESRRLTESHGRTQLSDPAWSPDGAHIYFAQGTMNRTDMQIARLDVQSTSILPVTSRPIGGAFRPLLSPDGRQMVYATENRDRAEVDLRIRHLTTGEDRHLVAVPWLSLTGVPAMDGRGAFPGYAFTPSGQELVVTAGGKIIRVDVKTGNIFAVPFHANVVLDVGFKLANEHRVEQGPVLPRIVHDPSFAPNGSRVAFSAMGKIFTMVIAADGEVQREPKRLTSGDAWEYKPVWSPDGRWITYVTWSMHGGHIWRMRSDGTGRPERLTQYSAFYTSVVYSPDGTKLVGLRGNAHMRLQADRYEMFGTDSGNQQLMDLVWLPAIGGEVRVVMTAHNMTAPDFAAHPERVYLYAPSGGNYDNRKGRLISVRLDGTERRTHLTVLDPGKNDAHLDKTIAIRGDGQWALVRSRDQLYVVAVPTVNRNDLDASIENEEASNTEKNNASAFMIDVSRPTTNAAVARLTDVGVDYFGWADKGDTVVWAIGSTLYRRPFSSIEFDPGTTRWAVQERARESHEAVKVTRVTLQFPRAMPQGTIVLRHATAITMNGDDVIDDADIVVTNNRITAIGPHGSVSVPSGAKIMDLTGDFVVPGYIDTHLHWSSVKRLNVLQPLSWAMMAALAYGVTTGIDVQTSVSDVLTYWDLVETGEMLGPRTFMTGPGIVIADRGFSSYNATLHYLKRYQQHYRLHYVKGYDVGTRQQHQWLIKAARALRIQVTAHPAIVRAMDGFSGHEHEIAVLPIYNDIVTLFAETNIGYNMTLMPISYFFQSENAHDDPKLNRFVPHNFLDEIATRALPMPNESYRYTEKSAQAAKIQRAGGLVSVASHGDLPGLGYHFELWSMGLGMTAGEALQAATIDGARVLGLDQDLGSLEVGKLADVVILNKNPIENVRNSNSIRYVMKNGALYEGDTLRQVWPVEKEAPELPWHSFHDQGRLVSTPGSPRH